MSLNAHHLLAFDEYTWWCNTEATPIPLWPVWWTSKLSGQPTNPAYVHPSQGAQQFNATLSHSADAPKEGWAFMAHPFEGRSGVHIFNFVTVAQFDLTHSLSPMPYFHQFCYVLWLHTLWLLQLHLYVIYFLWSTLCAILKTNHSGAWRHHLPAPHCFFSELNHPHYIFISLNPCPLAPSHLLLVPFPYKLWCWPSICLFHFMSILATQASLC